MALSYQCTRLPLIASTVGSWRQAPIPHQLPFFFLATCLTCRILVPRPEIEAIHPAVEAQCQPLDQGIPPAPTISFQLWPPDCLRRLTLPPSDQSSMSSHDHSNLKIQISSRQSPALNILMIFLGTKSNSLP